MFFFHPRTNHPSLTSILAIHHLHLSASSVSLIRYQITLQPSIPSPIHPKMSLPATQSNPASEDGTTQGRRYSSHPSLLMRSIFLIVIAMVMYLPFLHFYLVLPRWVSFSSKADATCNAVSMSSAGSSSSGPVFPHPIHPSVRPDGANVSVRSRILSPCAEETLAQNQAFYRRIEGKDRKHIERGWQGNGKHVG